MKLSILTFAMLFTIAANAQIHVDSVSVDGIYRSFLFNNPSPSGKERPLVFVLHGSGGNGRDMMKSATLLDSAVMAEGGVVVYPNGYKRYWNECRKASPAEANRIDVNEQGFFSGMIDYFVKNYSVDRRKVFAVGTSGGGHMVYKLGLTMPDTFRAIAALIANLPDSSNFDCVEARKAIPVMIANGTKDAVNPYDGGEVIAGFSLGFVRSTDKTFRYWADLAGHRGQPTMEVMPDTDPNDGKIIERYVYTAPKKTDVVLLKIVGGKHDYPGDIDIHLEAWDFFKKQMKKSKKVKR